MSTLGETVTATTSLTHTFEVLAAPSSRSAQMGSVMFKDTSTMDITLQVRSASKEVQSINCHSLLVRALGGPVMNELIRDQSQQSSRGQSKVSVDLPDGIDYATAQKVVAFIYDQSFDANSAELIKLIEAVKRLQLKDLFMETMKFVKADLAKQSTLMWDALHATRNVTFGNSQEEYEDVEMQPLIAKWVVKGAVAAINAACAQSNSEANTVSDLEYLLSFENHTMAENHLIVATVEAIK